MKIFTCLSVTALSLIWSQSGFAASPTDWGLGLQEPATPVAQRVYDFHNAVAIAMAVICAFVFILMGIVALKFNERANPRPAKFTHNWGLEIAWTIIPLIIVTIIGFYSVQLIHYMARVQQPDMQVEVTGHQWYWSYIYPDHGDIAFAAYPVFDEDVDVSKNQQRNLSTDYALVLPVDTNIEFLVTAADVLHSFAMPSFGIKTDAIPGRINSTWARIKRPGTYYGQCSELCGKEHWFMPVEIRALEKDDFARWAEIAQEDIDAGQAFLEEKRVEYSLKKTDIEIVKNQTREPKLQEDQL